MTVYQKSVENVSENKAGIKIPPCFWSKHSMAQTQILCTSLSQVVADKNSQVCLEEC